MSVEQPEFIIAAYRDWALQVPSLLTDHALEDVKFIFATTPQRLKIVCEGNKTPIIMIGWSWLIPDDILTDRLVVGMHPSDLPSYRGGSPIQHQIIDGIKDSLVTMFEVTNKLDAGNIIYKQPIDLRGHLVEVLDDISRASAVVLERFLNDYPDIPRESQDVSSTPLKKRLTPNDSELTQQLLSSLSAQQIFDFIRCRESLDVDDDSSIDPYPNAYVEDHTGKLMFRWVEFERCE